MPAFGQAAGINTIKCEATFIAIVLTFGRFYFDKLFHSRII